MHILIIPNKPIPTVNDIADADARAGRPHVPGGAGPGEEAGIAADGYRLLVNCNSHGGQEVYHLHLHLLGGAPLGPMLVKR